MATITATETVTPEVTVTMTETHISLWDRVRNHLNNWGRNIKHAARTVGGWFKRAFKWVANLAPVKWVVSKAKFVGGKAWSLARGPAGWIAAPAAAVAIAPKVITVLLAVAVAGVGVTAYHAVKSYRILKEASPEEVRELVEDLRKDFKGEESLEFTEPIEPGETDKSRTDYLQNLLDGADGNPGNFSELTARLHLLEVRQGHSKLKKTAKPHEVYRDCRRRAEALPLPVTGFEWDWQRMYRATRNEDARRNERLKLAEVTLTTV